MRYDLTDLKLFVAVAEEKSLSRGAKRCHLAPSSASLRLKTLEESFGTPLFTRQARGVIPNVAGLVMLEHARRCIAQLGQMHADMSPFSSGIVNHLSLFANNNAINSWLADDLLPFFQQFPSARISLEERLGTEILTAVSEGRSDLGIIAIDADHSELDFIPYREDRLAIVVSSDNPLKHHEQLHFVECLDTPFVSLLNGTAMHTYLINKAHALGRQMDIRIQVSGYPAILRLIAAGVGIGIVPLSALAGWNDSRLSVITLDEAWAVRHHRLCVRPETLRSNAFVAELVNILSRAAGLLNR